jgi:hypothetical protein
MPEDRANTENTTLMSDALTDITTENGAEEEAHGRHRGGHLTEEEKTPEANPHGRHRRAE